MRTPVPQNPDFLCAALQAAEKLMLCIRYGLQPVRKWLQTRFGLRWDEGIISSPPDFFRKLLRRSPGVRSVAGTA